LLPLILDPQKVGVGIAGSGGGYARRRTLLADAGAEPVLVPLGDPSALDGLQVLFIAGAAREDSARLAKQARAAGILVNVEDVPELCDFHVPATVRRGDLLLSVSTGGRAPGLAKLIREWIEARFGPDWSYRTDHLAHARSGWRKEGRSPCEVSWRTRDFVAKRHWL
jgi:precorrin-2 dehydrogenase/sirohydrochlorin ferrochelatase